MIRAELVEIRADCSMFSAVHTLTESRRSLSASPRGEILSYQPPNSMRIMPFCHASNGPIDLLENGAGARLKAFPVLRHS